MKLKRFLAAFLVSAFFVTSTHSLVSASEQAAAQVGQMAPPNVDAMRFEIARGEALQVVRAIRATGRYSEELGVKRTEKLFLKDLSQGFDAVKPLLAQQTVGTLTDDQAQAQWDSAQEILKGTPSEGLYERLSAEPGLSARDKLMKLFTQGKAAAMKRDLRAQIREAGSVSRYLASAEEKLASNDSNAQGGGVKPSDFAKAALLVLQVIFVVLMVGVAIFAAVVLGFFIYALLVTIFASLGSILLGALIFGGLILGMFLLVAGIQALLDFLDRAADGEFDPKPESQPAPGPGAMPAFQ